MLNVCMVGHGMMGIWHSDALLRVPDCQLHTVVGRRKDPTAKPKPAPTSGRKPSSTEEIAARYRYKKSTTDLDDALTDPEVDIVIVAGPRETHADMAVAALEHDKHTLVEIPIAMSLADADRVVAAAKDHGRTLGV